MKERCPVRKQRGISPWQKIRSPWSDIICKECNTGFRLHRGFRLLWHIAAFPATFVLVGLCFLYIPFAYAIYLAFLAIMTIAFTGAFVPLVEKENQEGVPSVLRDFL